MHILLTLLLAPALTAEPPSAAPPPPIAVSPAAAPAPPSAAPPTSEPPTAALPTRSRVQIHLTGFADDPVLAALRLRLPGHTIDRHADATAVPDLYLHIQRTDDTTATMQAITADGRAFDRSFTIEPGHEVRALATTAVNLLFAIEHGTVPPDKQGVAIPPPTLEPTPTPEPTPTLSTPNIRPTPNSATPTPDIRPTESSTPPPLAIRTADSFDAHTTLGLVAHGAATLGLAPRLSTPVAAAGGGLGLELRTPRSLTAALELRATGIHTPALGLARLRIAAGLGYTYRRGRFELPLLVILAVEPWWPLQAGRITTTQPGGAPVSRSPLLSAHLRLTPGVRVPLRHQQYLRLGPRLELGGAFILDHGPRAVSLDDPTGTPRARLGGLELSLGLELAIFFTLPR